MSDTLDRVCTAMVEEDNDQMVRFALGIVRLYSHEGVDGIALEAAIEALERNGCTGPAMSACDTTVTGELLILFITTYLDVRPEHSSFIDAVIGSP